MTAFPGASALTRLRVYDWPTIDGLAGGSPHLHTASTEAYVVLGGRGHVQTLSGDGYAEHPLGEGDVVWFTPGTVHRLVNGGDLDILVLMSDAGLAEAGDAVPDEARLATAARSRRDLAIEGYLRLRERVLDEGPGALNDLYAAATNLVAARAPQWRDRWRHGALAQAELTGIHLDALAHGRPEHLAASAVRRGASPAPPPGFGMCGRLTTWDLAR
jgi:mannose-6-phosphate isomerase-like protein (cupin superfamily)